MRPSVVLIAGLAALPLLAAPPSAAAQSGFHPRWEIPGFDISRDGGWRVKARGVASERARLLKRGEFGPLNAPLATGPRLAGPVVSGVFAVPMVLFYYQDTDTSAIRPTSQYDSVLFGSTPPAGRPYTLRTYYGELSNALFTMVGQSIGWAKLDSNEVKFTGQPPCFGNPFPGTDNCNGLFSSDAQRRMQGALRQALSKVDGAVDFGVFDNDGPNGIPNSGDDDGYVDMIGFAHGHMDGACVSSTNNHIWAHRWEIGAADGGGAYITNDARAGGGTIRVRDYFVQSGLGGANSCDSTQIMPVGTAAHEFGHALGLPDLYDTGGQTEGIGRWGLMATGGYSSPLSPARMEAWSLNELGWVHIEPLAAAGTYSFGAAPASDTAFFVNVQGTNTRSEYFLLENRQAAAADTALIRNACQVWYQTQTPPPCPGGLLVWHVDGAIMAGGGNSLNAGTIHGLKLEEADGARDLWCPGAVPLGCNRGDAGDVYPGQTGNTAFSFGTNPAAVKNLDSSFVGFAIDQITQVVPAGEMSFRLQFGALTVVRGSDSAAVISVDAVNYNVFRDLLDDGSTHSVSVADTQLSFDSRTRWRFASWSDAGARTHDITGSLSGGTITASLDRDFMLIATAGAGGTISASPSVNLAGELIAEGTSIQLTATPGAGVGFGGWTGDTIATNPVITLPMGRPYTVTATFLTTADVVAHLLGPTQPLTLAQQQYLDALGNNNGSFDIGDFLAWVKATGAP